VEVSDHSFFKILISTPWWHLGERPRRTTEAAAVREYIPFEKKMIDNWCRLLRTNSLKEGAV
jgi:hypothetical protein